MAGRNLTQKILQEHLARGKLNAGVRCAFCVDSTLVHDLSGLLALMGFDAMEIKCAAVPHPYLFMDHNLIAMDATGPDNGAFLRSCAQRFGLCYSRAGNGICHSLYYHRLGIPGTLLIGADSHTATAGALGMLGIGMGGIDVSVVMSGEPVQMNVPKVLGVRLEGQLRPGVSAKDIALTLLRRLTVRGCVGKIVEYTGDGVKTLSVPQRATIANMGAEMGATSSIFPADDTVLHFLAAQQREKDFVRKTSDPDATYDETMMLQLDEVVPMVALPGQPDRCLPVAQAEPVAFSQIFIGSCTNGSYTDLARAAEILRGRKIAPGTDVLVSCGNRQIYSMLARDGYLQALIDAGARILECSCGPCMGIGQAPASGATVLRTTNRNYPGRSGTVDAQMYLCGTETAAASALSGTLTAVEQVMDPALLERIQEPTAYPVDDSMFLHYEELKERPELQYGSAICPIPVREPLPQTISGAVSLKLGDGISTDDIVPPNPKAFALRCNIPELSRYLFHHIDPDFAARAAELGDSIIVAGDGYAQGSSREHAAIGCMYLGVQAVLVKSIHRIHRSNLINYGVIPLLFENTEDEQLIQQGDFLEIERVREQMDAGERIIVRDCTRDLKITAILKLQDRERQILEAGGLIPYMRGRRRQGERA